jgi:WD40 repeat protein
MSLKGHKSYINGLAFLQPGNNGANPGDVILVASSGDPALHTWNVTTGKWLESIPLSHHPHKLKASPNGSWLAYINGSQLQLLRVKNGKPSFGRAVKGHTKPIRDFSFQSDDKIVGTAGEDGQLILWDPNQGTQLAQLDDPFGGIKNPVSSIDFHPTDDYVVATEQSSGVVRVWSSLSRKYDIGFTTSSDAHLARFLPKQGHPFNLVYGDIFFHQLTFVSYTMKDGWSFDGKGHTAKIEHIAPHPSGSWFATGSIDKTIRIWELPNDNTPKGGLRHTLTRHTDRIMSTRFSPNGQWLVTSDLTGEVAVWECK